MVLTYQPPFHQREQIKRRVNQIFDPLEHQENLAVNPNKITNIQFEETPKTLKLKAILPRLNPESINIQAIDNSVLISGEVNTALEVNTTAEPLWNPFRWVVALPVFVTSKLIEVQYDNGMLTLLLQRHQSI